MTHILKPKSSLVHECFTATEAEFSHLLERAYETARKEFSDRIAFHSPGMAHYETEFHTATDPYRFPSISITGTNCALNCEHCNGTLLDNMIPARTPEALWNVCEEIVRRGGTGCLISGGSTQKGNTPLRQFIPTIRRAKSELELDIVVHTGIVYSETVRDLASAGIDGAMMDIIGSSETLRQVYHLDASPEVFEESMRLLEDHGIPFSPHVIAGLHFGELLGEEEAIHMISMHNPDSVVVVAFMPLDCTPMENVTPATPVDIARVIAACRIAVPDKPLTLGCARPLGEHRRLTDRLAIDAGVNGIAYPSEEAYEYSLERGLQPHFSDQCCSLVAKLLE